MSELQYYLVLNLPEFGGYKSMPAMLSMEDRWRYGYISFQEYYDWVGQQADKRDAFRFDRGEPAYDVQRDSAGRLISKTIREEDR